MVKLIEMEVCEHFYCRNVYFGHAMQITRVYGRDICCETATHAIRALRIITKNAQYVKEKKCFCFYFFILGNY